MTAGADRYDRRASAGPMQIASSASWTGERIAVGLAVGDDRLGAERPARPQDAQRDLAPVGDQDLAEHQASQASRRGRGRELEQDQLLAVLDGVARLDEARPDDAVGRCDDLLRDRRAVDRAEPVAGTNLGARPGLRARMEDADRRRGRDDPRPPGRRHRARRATHGRSARHGRRAPARPRSGPPADAAPPGPAPERAVRSRSPGRRSRVPACVAGTPPGRRPAGAAARASRPRGPRAHRDRSRRAWR